MSEQNISEQNKALIRRWFEEVWNKGRADAIPELFADDRIAQGLSDDPPNPLRGPAGFLPFHAQFREAFPNIEVSVEDHIAEGDMVATRCSVRGKHAGDSLGFKAPQDRVDSTGSGITPSQHNTIFQALN